MNARFFVILALPVALGLAAVATAAAPASISSLADGFETEGDLGLSVGYTAAGLVASITVDVEDCGTYTYTSSSSGSTARVGSTTTWSLPIDLSACQGEAAGIVRTHHCDGYGNAFETCEADEYGEAGAERTVSVSLQMSTRSGVAQCTTDLDGDGDNECDVIVGTLLPDGGGVTEVYVPARYWTDGSDGGTCISRTSGSGLRDPEDQGGTSCEDLGL